MLPCSFRQSVFFTDALSLDQTTTNRLVPSSVNNLSEVPVDRERTTRLDPPPSSTDSSKRGASKKLSSRLPKSTTLRTPSKRQQTEIKTNDYIDRKCFIYVVSESFQGVHWVSSGVLPLSRVSTLVSLACKKSALFRIIPSCCPVERTESRSLSCTRRLRQST